MRSNEFAAGRTLSNWRRERGDPSLSEVHRTIAVASHGSVWRKLGAFLGPGYLVAVGYMDPGNWATSLAGGASSATRCSSSPCCRTSWRSSCRRSVRGSASRPGGTSRRPAGTPTRAPSPGRSGFSAEIAICATDLAEVIGTAIGSQSAFRYPARVRRVHHRTRRVPDPLAAEQGLPLARGFRHRAARRHCRSASSSDRARPPGLGTGDPRLRADDRDLTNPDMLYLGIGIIGATVMPHNLYLHSASCRRGHTATPPAESARP